jgi:hypothetical protein
MSDDSIGNLFSSLAGHLIAGGCTYCDATQKMTEVAPGVWRLVVAHDDNCPSLRARKAKSN